VSAVLDILSWICLLGGGFFFVVGMLGVVRMPDVFTRLHSLSVADTLGVGLMIVGMLLQIEDWATDWLVAVRLVILLVIMWLTGAVATHALAHAALHAGEKPLLADEDGKLVATDCAVALPELAGRMAAPLVSEMVDAPAPSADRDGEGAPSSS
jgi:multicomponent Na+:H+ antiporter subunit G